MFVVQLTRNFHANLWFVIIYSGQYMKDVSTYCTVHEKMYGANKVNGQGKCMNQKLT